MEGRRGETLALASPGDSNEDMDARREEGRVRLAMAVGIALTILGLAVGATVNAFAGGGICMVGWGVLGYAVHRLGRLGRA